MYVGAKPTIIGTYDTYLTKNSKVICDGDYYYLELCRGKQSPCTLAVHVRNIDAFRTSLNQAKTKYIEWAKVAKENNVTLYVKRMEICFPNCYFSWVYCNECYVNGNAIPEPTFMVKNGNYFLSMFAGKEFKSHTNRYITEEAYWVFSSIEQIEAFERLISQEMLSKVIEEKENARIEHEKTDNLFK
jgi:hypothetical protein